MKTYLHFSEATNLAIHALAYLHGLKALGPISVGQIASALQVSESHLSKVMQRLVHEGVIRSTRGARGGFVFARDPEKIAVAEIVTVVDGPHAHSHCLLGKPICKSSHCKLQALMRRVSSLVEEELGQIKLSEVLEKTRIPR